MNEPQPKNTWTDAELDELLGVHALDAIESTAERAAIEAYVARSPRARAELDSHRQVAAAMGNAVISAPPELWARISDHLPAGAGDAAGLNAERPRPTSPFFIAPARRRRRSSVRGPLRIAGSGHTTTARPWIAAAAAAACIAVASSGLALHRSSELQSATSKNRQLQSSVTMERERSAQLGQKLQILERRSPTSLRLAQLEGDSNVRKVVLMSTTGASLGHVLLSTSGEGYVIGDTLPELPAGRTYQLWGVQGSAVLSLGVMGRSPKAMPFAGDEKWSQLVLTDEVSPGVAVSKAGAAAVATLDQA